jgi:hypothetical protein
MTLCASILRSVELMRSEMGGLNLTFTNLLHSNFMNYGKLVNLVSQHRCTAWGVQRGRR